MRRLAATVVAVVLVAVAGGCGDDDGDTDAGGPGRTTSSTTTSTSTSSTTTTAGPPPPVDGVLPGAATTPVSAPPTTPTALLTEVRAAIQEGFDRVVFEFENRAPGHKVEYVSRPVREDGSGNEVAVEGAAILEVRMEAASGADLSGTELRRTYTGPTRIRTDTAEVVEVVRTGDFEGVLTWVFGVREKLPFRVTVLEGPPRLVIDIAAG